MFTNFQWAKIQFLSNLGLVLFSPKMHFVGKRQNLQLIFIALKGVFFQNLNDDIKEHEYMTTSNKI